MPRGESVLPHVTGPAGQLCAVSTHASSAPVVSIILEIRKHLIPKLVSLVDGCLAGCRAALRVVRPSLRREGSRTDRYECGCEGEGERHGLCFGQKL
jgi:hypothetical protein